MLSFCLGFEFLFGILVLPTSQQLKQLQFVKIQILEPANNTWLECIAEPFLNLHKKGVGKFGKSNKTRTLFAKPLDFSKKIDVPALPVLLVKDPRYQQLKTIEGGKDSLQVWKQYKLQNRIHQKSIIYGNPL